MKIGGRRVRRAAAMHEARTTDERSKTMFFGSGIYGKMENAASDKVAECKEKEKKASNFVLKAIRRFQMSRAVGKLVNVVNNKDEIRERSR